MLGGYSDVARELNRVFEWPDERVVSRQWVQAIHRRATPNRWRQLPPSPVEVREHAGAHRTRYVFRVEDWVNYVGPGVRGARRKGWVTPLLRPGVMLAS